MFTNWMNNFFLDRASGEMPWNIFDIYKIIFPSHAAQFACIHLSGHRVSLLHVDLTLCCLLTSNDFFMQPPWPLCPWFDQWWKICEANVVINACWISSCVTVQSIPHLRMMTSSKAQLWRPFCHLVHSEDTKCSLLCVQTTIWLSSFNN